MLPVNTVGVLMNSTMSYRVPATNSINMIPKPVRKVMPWQENTNWKVVGLIPNACNACNVQAEYGVSKASATPANMGNCKLLYVQ